MFVRSCGQCGKTFEAKVANKRFCDQTCFDAHRKIYNQQNVESRKVDRFCRQCKQTYRRVYEKSGFCSISCGSRWNIEHGVSDAWKSSNLGKRSGKFVACNECDKQIYVVPNQYTQDHHFCDQKCKGKFFGKKYKASGNPMFGRKLSERSIEKQRRTLLQNHGVTNAFFLSKHRTVSRAQLEILNHLSSSVPHAKFEGEQLFTSGSKKYFVDIFSEPAKMVIEYNGDYWHCNPATYSGSYYHERKKKYAHEIWKEDNERAEIFKNFGYQTYTIWEKDYLVDKKQVLNHLTTMVISSSKGALSG